MATVNAFSLCVCMLLPPLVSGPVRCSGNGILRLPGLGNKKPCSLLLPLVEYSSIGHFFWEHGCHVEKPKPIGEAKCRWSLQLTSVDSPSTSRVSPPSNPVKMNPATASISLKLHERAQVKDTQLCSTSPQNWEAPSFKVVCNVG